MIMHHSRITMVRKKKEPGENKSINRPPKLSGKEAKPKYVAPQNWDAVTFETTTSGSEEEVMQAANDRSYHYIYIGFRDKTPPGKEGDYEVIKVEHLRECGVTADHYGFVKPVEKLRPWPNPWPGDPDFDIKKHGYKEEKKYVKEFSTQLSQEQSNSFPGKEQPWVYRNNGSVVENGGQPSKVETATNYNFPKPKFSK